MPVTNISYRDIVRKEVSQFASLLHAYQECSAEIQQIVDQMAAIIADGDSSPEEVEHATDALVEALFPSFCIDAMTYYDGLRRTGDFQEAGNQLDAQENHFAEKLRELMERDNISQQRLAEMTGVTQPAISNILNRQCRPQQRTVLRFAEAFKVDPEVLWPPL